MKKARLFCGRELGLTVAVLGVISGPSSARGQLSGPEEVESCGQPFQAAQLVAGNHVIVPDTNVTLRMPNGWYGRIEKGRDGYPVYRVIAQQAGAAGAIILAHRPLTGEEGNKPLERFLAEGASALVGTEEGTITESRLFTLGGHCGGRMMFRTAQAEGSATVIRGGDWLYMIFAKYPYAVRGPLRAGIDTIVATATLAPPPVSSPAEAEEQPRSKKKSPSDCEAKYRVYEDRMCHCYHVCGM